jgi:hypothetical protein
MVAMANRVEVFVDRIPVISLMDMALKQVQNSEPQVEPSSTDSLIKLIFISISAYFVYPRVVSVAAFTNLSAGALHIGLGCIQRFRTSGAEEETWKPIAHHIHKGFCHIIAAGYDVGIGLLLRKKYFCLAGVLLAAQAPSLVALWHQKIFRKPGDKHVVNLQLPPELLTKLLEILPEKISHWLFASLSDEQPERTYLSKTCLVYTIAKKFTLGMTPVSSEAEPAATWSDYVKSFFRPQSTGPQYGL